MCLLLVLDFCLVLLCVLVRGILFQILVYNIVTFRGILIQILVLCYCDYDGKGVLCVPCLR